MHHYRKTRKRYVQHNKGDKKLPACTFCHTYANKKENIRAENDTMFVVPNRVSYDMFEGLPVLDHLMVIPKRHVETLGDFSQAEKLDQMDIVGQYERQGYSIYSRGMGSINRSVRHQHTHMMKLGSKKSRFILYAAKPHLLIHK